MRGKVPPLIGFGVRLRITPAYAGKSFVLPVHRLPLLGSPPHMRGKGNYFVKQDFRSRITPAYAGKRGYPGRCRNGR